MKFEVGQKVLCVNNHFNYGPSRLRKGKIYTICGFYLCACGSHQVILMEIPDMTNMKCGCQRSSFRMQSYYNWRFVPLKCSEILSEQTDVLEEIIVS